MALVRFGCVSYKNRLIVPNNRANCLGRYSHLSNKREVTLTDFENSTVHKKNPPSMFIDFLDYFHPPLQVYCIYVLAFAKKSHPPRLFQPPRLLER